MISKSFDSITMLFDNLMRPQEQAVYRFRVWECIVSTEIIQFYRSSSETRNIKRYERLVLCERGAFLNENSSFSLTNILKSRLPLRGKFLFSLNA